VKRDEFVLRTSDVAQNVIGVNPQERTCEECGRQFSISNTRLWAYRIIAKGCTSWFCRYNCMRAGEKRLEGTKAGRKKELRTKENKPSKAVLEKDLRTDMTLALIAEKYTCSIATISNWVKSYGLQGIRGIRKVSSESGVDPMVEETDGATDDQMQADIDPSKVANLCTCPSDGHESDPNEAEPDDREPLLTQDEIEELEGRLPEPIDPEPEPEPQREPYEEVWGDIRDDITTLRRMYAQDADKSFFDRLHGLFLEVRG